MGTTVEIDTLARIEAGRQLVEELRDRQLEARLLGGVAVALHCPGGPGSAPHREIGDIDVVVARSDARKLGKVLPDLGWEAEKRFNALHGGHRMIFHGPAGKLDVFVESFKMCHELKLEPRLEVDYPTLPVSDLLMTKLQIVELNEKDAQDAELLLAAHSLGEGPGDQFDVAYLSSLVGGDWGLWRTSTRTLEQLIARDGAAAVSGRALHEAFMDAPKSRSFRMRARVGERVQWYELPDDLD